MSTRRTVCLSTIVTGLHLRRQRIYSFVGISRATAGLFLSRGAIGTIRGALGAWRSIDGHGSLGAIGCRVGPRDGRALDDDGAAVAQKDIRSRSPGNGIA